MNKRNLAIDMFRGLTMVLMVFVNDFWTVLDIPHFLEPPIQVNSATRV